MCNQLGLRVDRKDRLICHIHGGDKRPSRTSSWMGDSQPSDHQRRSKQCNNPLSRSHHLRNIFHHLHVRETNNRTEEIVNGIGTRALRLRCNAPGAGVIAIGIEDADDEMIVPDTLRRRRPVGRKDEGIADHLGATDPRPPQGLDQDPADGDIHRVHQIHHDTDAGEEGRLVIDPWIALYPLYRIGEVGGTRDTLVGAILGVVGTPETGARPVNHHRGNARLTILLGQGLSARKRMGLVISINIITKKDRKILCHLPLPSPRNQQDLNQPPNDVVVGLQVVMIPSDTSRGEKGRLLQIATEFKRKLVWEHSEESLSAWI